MRSAFIDNQVYSISIKVTYPIVLAYLKETRNAIYKNCSKKNLKRKRNAIYKKLLKQINDLCPQHVNHNWNCPLFHADFGFAAWLGAQEVISAKIKACCFHLLRALKI
jgi:hypothetical protein